MPQHIDPGECMSDGKPKWDEPGNAQSSKPDEAGELAREHNISPDRAQMLIDRFGHDPEKLKAEAKALGAGRGPGLASPIKTSAS